MSRHFVCEAYFVALSLAHRGQGCPRYRRLCRLLTYFKPPLRTSPEAAAAAEAIVERWASSGRVLRASR